LRKIRKEWNKNYNQIFIPGIAVVVQNNNVDAALRKFKKKVQEERILQIVKDKQEYVKPSEKRRKAKAAARARSLKKQGKL
jgi:small subunit ribosomal protein S21